MFQFVLIQNIAILCFSAHLYLKVIFESQCHDDLHLRSTSKIEEIERNDR